MGERIEDDQGNLICTFAVEDDGIRFYGKKGSLGLDSFVLQIFEKFGKASTGRKKHSNRRDKDS